MIIFLKQVYRDTFFVKVNCDTFFANLPKISKFKKGEYFANKGVIQHRIKYCSAQKRCDSTPMFFHDEIFEFWMVFIGNP